MQCRCRCAVCISFALSSDVVEYIVVKSPLATRENCCGENVDTIARNISQNVLNVTTILAIKLKSLISENKKIINTHTNTTNKSGTRTKDTSDEPPVNRRATHTKAATNPGRDSLRRALSECYGHHCYSILLLLYTFATT